MKFEINANTLINDIMSKNDAAVLLFAPSGTGKTDFLTELAGRYRKVYWFNALMGDADLFTHTFIERVLAGSDDGRELQNKLMQLLYSKSEFNDESVAIAAVLDYISNIKGDCLMVFERMEHLPKKFDMSILERIIRYSPNNLKVVISSDYFLNIDYMNFGGKRPKLIDETILIPRAGRPDSRAYLEELPEKDIAFLAYLSDLVAMRKEFVAELNPHGVEVLEYLSRKECYVTTRDDRFFRMNTALRTYLMGLKDGYKEQNREYNEIDVRERYAEFEFASNEYFRAIDLFFTLKRYDRINEIIKAMLNKEQHLLLKIRDYAKTFVSAKYESHPELPYYTLFLVYIHEHQDYEFSVKNLAELYNRFKELGDGWGEAAVLACIGRISLNDDEAKLYAELVTDTIERFKGKDDRLIYALYCLSVPYRKEFGISLSEFDRHICGDALNEDFLFIKGVENLVMAYFEMGNYRKAQEKTDRVKEYFPWYVIPHTFIPFYYYQGEIEKAEKTASDALDFALSNGIEKDISILYTTLGMVDSYYGRISDALQKFDKAVKLDKKDSRTKYLNISQRCLAIARYRDADYAKDIAHFNLKHCEFNAKEYVNDMQIALSYAYLKLGYKEKACHYAKRCIQNSPSRSIGWLMGMGIATAHMLESGDLKDAGTLVKNIISASENFGMEMIIIDYYDDVFKSLISYAKNNGIGGDYVARISAETLKLKNKKGEPDVLKINMFGDVQITVGGEDVLWKTRKSRDLFLHYILADGVGIDRNVIIDVLWKDYLYESAINNLKTTNNIIRKTLKASNVEFLLDYINSRYILKLDNFESDYTEFKALAEKFRASENLSEMAECMRKMLKLYKSDFAQDINYPEFNDERKSLKQELIMSLLKLIRKLAVNGDYLEAKGFLTSLSILDKQNDYAHMIQELDSHINIIS